jgi:V-type H+-transporting ATPase subunit d
MFNIDNGYLEGLCRGFKTGILTQTDYLNLVQCETLEGGCGWLIISSPLIIKLFIIFFMILDLKLHLAGTDYGNFLANEPSPIAVSTLDEKLREKVVHEFQHMRNCAVEPLSTFLDYIT